jgi:hypothetical protein
MRIVKACAAVRTDFHSDTPFLYIGCVFCLQNSTVLVRAQDFYPATRLLTHLRLRTRKKPTAHLMRSSA